MTGCNEYMARIRALGLDRRVEYYIRDALSHKVLENDNGRAYKPSDEFLGYAGDLVNIADDNYEKIAPFAFFRHKGSKPSNGDHMGADAFISNSIVALMGFVKPQEKQLMELASDNSCSPSDIYVGLAARVLQKSVESGVLKTEKIIGEETKEVYGTAIILDNSPEV